MLETVLTNPIIAFVILVGLVVFFHELGHFLVGRMLGVDVDEFSIGFGPKAFGFTRGRTEYKVCWLPLGGYVRFYGAEIGGEIPLEKKEKSILTARLYKRVLISAAGPFANFVLSFVIMVILSGVGMPHASSRISVLPGKAAFSSGMQSGDRIVEMQGKEVETWRDMTKIVSESPGLDLAVVVERPGVEEPVSLTLTPESVESESVFGEKVQVGRIGVTQFFPSMGFVRAQGGLVEAFDLKTGEKVTAVNERPVQYLHEFVDELRQTWSVQSPSELAENVISGKLGKALVVQTTDRKIEVSPSQLTRWAQKWVEGWKNLEQEPPSHWQSVLLTTDLLVAGYREGAEASTTSALSSCGLKENVAIRAFSVSKNKAFELLSSPVDLSIGLKNLNELAVSKSLELESKGEGNANRSAPARFQVVGASGEVAMIECNLPMVKRRDQLNRDQWVLDFPVKFQTTGQPMEEVILASDGLFEAIQDGANAVYEQSGTIFTGLRKLVSGSIPLANLGGPIQIARVAGDAAEGGLLLFFLTVSWMSVNIGMFNLLPLPALDGGALLMQGVEAAYGRPLPENVQHGVQRIGVLIILGLVVVVFYNDILRLLGG